ncbi:MAG TPA: lytic transglycosylase domain-containing protein [Negativicutes bacterium]
MESINKVFQRIASIEQRFQQPAVSVGNFTAALATAQQSETADKKTAGTGNVAQMIQLAAGKYGVDSKLAMAVAQTESGLSPDVVSSAGAVGVMQLMPQTASALGVRDIYDPRENIDGGVRYLKQMLTTFNGDTAKAVAAYNAGPQAVKDYNGIPPYPETKAYVAKVMALSN